jgi:hypothetical protein
MIDPGAQAFTRLGIQIAGIAVRFERIVGFAPNAATTSASVIAIVRKYALDTVTISETGYASSKPGAIRQGDREVLVMAADLEAAGFPLPVKKNDRVVIEATGDTFSIITVDAYHRAMAGCIEIEAAGSQ